MTSQVRQHTWYEDLFGLATGSILIAIAIDLMQASGLLTGGAVGVAQLLSKNLDVSLSVLYVLISIPFFILAIWKKGTSFATRSFVNILLVSYLVDLFPRYIQITVTNQIAGAIISNTLGGIGVLAVFRHNSSLGGFQVVALMIQEKLKIQAGYAQALIDLAILAIGLGSYGLHATAVSLIGVIVFNGILALNHHPDLYIGRST